MWQKFTERARRAVFFAQEEAGGRGWNLVDTDHLFLGLLRERDSVACRILRGAGVDPDRMRNEVSRLIPRGEGRNQQDMQLTPESKRAIEAAYDEAGRMGSEFTGTEHLLLGLVREGNGVAGEILTRKGVDFARVRQAVADVQDCAVESPTVPDVVDDALRGRDLVSIRDLSAEEIWKIFETAKCLKSRTLQEEVEHPILAGKTLAMIFEKPSLRTRVTFEAGMTQLGGHAIYLQPSDIRMGERESVSDTARNLERWVHGVMARTFAHQTVLDLAKYAGIPVINGLSDLEHPCQALTDFFTIHEKKGDLSRIKLAYIGDGCNTCHSLMLLAAKVGASMSVGCPEGYEPDEAIVTSARRDARETGASLSVTNAVFEAVDGANVIYTDVWASMGLEEEREKRLSAFQPFQVNEKLVDAAADDVVVMHCMPAHRGEEITDEVLDGPRSIAFDQAENRLHVQKAILALVM